MRDMINRTFSFQFKNPLTPIRRWLRSCEVTHDVVTGEIRYYRRDGAIGWRQGSYIRVKTTDLACILDTTVEQVRLVMRMLYPDYNYFESREGIEEQRAGLYTCISFEGELPKVCCGDCLRRGEKFRGVAYVCDATGKFLDAQSILNKTHPSWCPINA